MTLKLFRWVLVITNLILIFIPITVLILGYLFFIPNILNDLNDQTNALSVAFGVWSAFLVLTSVCFLGVAFTTSCCLHLIAALLLSCPLALGVWLVVEQFLYRPNPNWTIVGVSFTASLIWGIQVLTELLMACILCCSSSAPTNKKEDPESGSVLKKRGDSTDGEPLVKEEMNEEGTEEEREKLVVYQQEMANQLQLQQQQQQQQQQGPGGTFVPSPQAPPIQEVDEEPDDDDDEEEEEEEEEQDSQARDHLNNGPNGVHPQELPLRSIPEEKQQLLQHPHDPHSQMGPGGQCPLATPEDTGV